MAENVEAEISQMQVLEQNLRGIEMQKQNMQLQLMESENSLKELKGYSGKVFKIVGPVMIEAKSDEVLKEISDKKDVLKVRLESLEKQEKTFREKFDDLHKKIMESIKEKSK
jgi:prefoldin beta subunit